MFSGIDIVQIARLESLVEGHEGRLERLFSPAEIAYCRRKGQGAVASYAGLYAAKEAFFKAMGSGFRGGLWRDVEVGHTEEGAPYLIYTVIMQKKRRKNLPICLFYLFHTMVIMQLHWLFGMRRRV